MFCFLFFLFLIRGAHFHSLAFSRTAVSSFLSFQADVDAFTVMTEEERALVVSYYTNYI